MSNLLVIADTPTVNSGFACVVRNLLPHWLPRFNRIDVWGINYDGWPHSYPYCIYPAGWQWSKPRNLKRLLEFIQAGDYTHLWILQDTFLLSENKFPEVLSKLCKQKGIRIVTYFPVDAPVDDKWMGIVNVSDAAATFTRYGQEQCDIARHGTGAPWIHAIPHGVDTSKFFPMSQQDRDVARAYFFPQWTQARILVNVNRNERRKAMVHSLQVLRELIETHGPCFKLYLHCVPQNADEGIDLFQIGKQLGLEYGTDWLAPEDKDFVEQSGIFGGLGRFSVEELNAIYNASDACITTTLGEGWGLSITEAAAAGLKVIAPWHTSIPDLQKILPSRITAVPLLPTAIVNPADNSRVRYPVNGYLMANAIANATSGPRYERTPLSEEEKKHLSWERIAKEWLELLQP